MYRDPQADPLGTYPGVGLLYQATRESRVVASRTTFKATTSSR